MTNMFSPLTLPCGHVLPNRLCKAAMEENMADQGQIPGEALTRLYGQWAKGAPGLILTGNVMVAPDAMTGPGGVYLGKETLGTPGVRKRFETWAAAGKSGGSAMVMQISHPGRQVYAAMGTQGVSASDTRLNMSGPAAKMFSRARALSGEEIRALITRFADTAQQAVSCGFDGVQIHAAHGYLAAQFLSPLSNLRNDEWGGSLETRARFLLEIVRAVRARLGLKAIVAVKLNSADFQKGGFDIDDAAQVTRWLNSEGVDFVELSGGNYESAAMMGLASDGRAQSTAQREMYFLDFARDIAKVAAMPIMVTGGVTRRSTAEQALEGGGVDMIGIARAMAYNPNLPHDWKDGQNLTVSQPVIKTKNAVFKSLALMAMTKANLYRLGDGHAVKLRQSPLMAVIKQQIKTGALTKRYKAWLAARGRSV